MVVSILASTTSTPEKVGAETVQTTKNAPIDVLNTEDARRSSMSKKQENVPKLRFPGFADPWEMRKLKEVSNKVIEKNKESLYSETLTNSAEYGIVNQREFFDKDISNERNLNGYYVVRENDFVYNPRISSFAPVGPIKRNKLGRTGVMSPLYYVFRTHDIDIAFLEYFFESAGWHSFMKLNGDSGARSDRFAIKDAVFIEMRIPYPSLEEQAQVGAFFENMDHLITLHQRKLSNVKKLKVGLLQKMFPKAGEDFPEVRFPGFTGAWERQRLKKITLKIGSGKTPKGGDASYVLKGVPLIRSQNIRDNVIDLNDVVYITPRIHQQMGNSLVIKDDVLLNITGASIGRSAVYRLYSDANVNQHVCIIRPNQGYSSDFIQLNLTSLKGQQQIMNTQAGSGREGLNFQQIGQMNFMFPSIEEQGKISFLLRDIDHLITLHQRKLEHLQEQKKALLQQMFV